MMFATKTIWGLLLGLVLWLVAPTGAQAGMNRYWMAVQQDFGGKKGYILDFENSSEGNAPIPLKTLKIYAGVGDGTNWHFYSATPDWKYNHDYAVVATFGPKGAELRIDGEKVAGGEGNLVPDTGPTLTNYIPEWAHSPAEYLIEQTSLQMTTDKGHRRDFAFPPPRPLPLMLFEPQMPQEPQKAQSWNLQPGETLTVKTTIRLLPMPNDLHALAPFIDRYGQAIAANWPGKVKSDADLIASVQDENQRLAKMKTPPGYDAWGGVASAGWREKPTGYFHTVKHSGFWWLVSPQGNPCFYNSVGSAPSPAWDRTPVTGREFLFADLPPRDGLYAAIWNRNDWGTAPDVDSVAFHGANMIRKYGPDWQAKANASAVRRFRAWGFGGLGKWCGPQPNVADIPVIGSSDVPNLVRHPDPFDPKIQVAFRESLRKQIEPRRTDARVVGWSYGNEYDGIVTLDEVKQILQKPAETPAKRALIDEALTSIYKGETVKMAVAWQVQLTPTVPDGLYQANPTPPAADLETLRRFYADHFYDMVYRTVKAIDPNHLYLGFWISPGWWENEEDWRLIARHCDVIGYDRYSPDFVDDRLARLMKEADKPVYCGEFSFPPTYDGARGYGVYNAAWARSEAEAGDKYARWMRDAAQNPYCVGLGWFQYRDEPLTGRGPAEKGTALVMGEHYAFGLVDVTDRPKWGLVERVRQANLGAAALRLKAEK